jgi:hypothetical protein
MVVGGLVVAGTAAAVAGAAVAAAADGRAWLTAAVVELAAACGSWAVVGVGAGVGTGAWPTLVMDWFSVGQKAVSIFGQQEMSVE